MSVNPQIEAFVTQMNTFMSAMDVSITGIQGDIKSLNDTITLLQNTPSTLTAEDQALLDTLQAKAEAMAGAIDAIDAMTPPVTPTP